MTMPTLVAFALATPLASSPVSNQGETPVVDILELSGGVDVAFVKSDEREDLDELEVVRTVAHDGVLYSVYERNRHVTEGFVVRAQVASTGEQLWQTEYGTPREPGGAHTEEEDFSDLALAPDGSHLLLLGFREVNPIAFESTLARIETADGTARHLTSFSGLGNRVSVVRFSPDSERYFLDGPGSTLSAFDASSHAQLWQQTSLFVDELVAGHDAVFARVRDVGGSSTPLLAAYAAETGTLLWKGVGGEPGNGALALSPDETMLVSTDDFDFSFSPPARAQRTSDGSVLWETLGRSARQMLFAPDGTTLFLRLDFYVHVLDASSGAVLDGLGPAPLDAISADGAIIAGGNGAAGLGPTPTARVGAVEVATGTRLWEVPYSKNRPAIVEGGRVLVGWLDDGTSFLPDESFTAALDLATGAESWRSLAQAEAKLATSFQAVGVASSGRRPYALRQRGDYEIVTFNVSGDQTGSLAGPDGPRPPLVWSLASGDYLWSTASLFGPGTITRLAPDGTTVWTRPGLSEVAWLSSDESVLVSPLGETIIAVDVDTGADRWSTSLDLGASEETFTELVPSPGGSVLYVVGLSRPPGCNSTLPCEELLAAIDLDDGPLLWSRTLSKEPVGLGVQIGGGVTPDGSLLLVGYEGALRTVDPATGASNPLILMGAARPDRMLVRPDGVVLFLGDVSVGPPLDKESDLVLWAQDPVDGSVPWSRQLDFTLRDSVIDFSFERSRERVVVHARERFESFQPYYPVSTLTAHDVRGGGELWRVMLEGTYDPAAFGGETRVYLAGRGVTNSASFVGIDLPALSGSTDDLSLSAGDSRRFFLDAGLAHAGSVYWLLGGTGGTAPGLALPGGRTLPLVAVGYSSTTQLSDDSLGELFLEDSVGVLDANGRGVARLEVPPGVDPFAGRTLSHTYLVLDGNGNVAFVSPPTSFRIVR